MTETNQDKGLLSNLYNQIVRPVKNYLNEIKDYIDADNRSTERARRENIEIIYELAFRNADSTSYDDMKVSIVHHMKMNKDQMNEFGEITLNDVLLYAERLDDNTKQDLQDNRQQYVEEYGIT